MLSSGTEVLISNECIELKKSTSLVSSSSSSEDQERLHASKVSGFMENAAPSVVAKYINMNKMNSHTLKKNDGRRMLYETSIFKTALAIKTGKDVQGVVNSSDSSTNTATSSLSTDRSNSCIMKHQRIPEDTMTPMQRRMLKVKQYRREKRGYAGDKADGMNVREGEDASFDSMDSASGMANAFMRMNTEKMSNCSFKQGTDFIQYEHKDMYHSVAAPPPPSPYELISLREQLSKQKLTI